MAAPDTHAAPSGAAITRAMIARVCRLTEAEVSERYWPTAKALRALGRYAPSHWDDDTVLIRRIVR
jgi:hypothetical protein